MTRFFLTLEESIGLLFKAAEESIGGETFVMNMPAAYIKDVADILIDVYGNAEITEIGSKPGEKLDEMLISKHEAVMSYKYDDAYYVILPFNPKQILVDKYSNLEKFSQEEFSSKTFIMQHNDIRQMLKKGNFI
jgi:FlaA1/EpsC-like NDP-sugar epimerase